MRAALSLIFVAVLAAASPMPLSPSARQTPYDVKIDTSGTPTYSNKHPECQGLLRSGCGPLHLGGSGFLASSPASGILGSQNGMEVTGLHVRRRMYLKKSILNGIDADSVTSPVKGLNLLPDQPLQGLGLKRSIPGNTKRIIGLGRPGNIVPGIGLDTNTCSVGQQYCCKHIRRYSDSRNAGLLDGALVQDGLLNDVLVGLTCDLIAGALAPGSCLNRVCCTGQRTNKGGDVVNLGCTPLAGALAGV